MEFTVKAATQKKNTVYCLLLHWTYFENSSLNKHIVFLTKMIT